MNIAGCALVRCAHRWLSAAGLALLAGCSAEQNPMRTSLVDITGESRTVPVYTDWFHLFPIAEHRQATSVAGVLLMPDVGQEFQFSGGHDVTTAVGVAVLQSYRLIAESEPPADACGHDAPGAAVTAVRDALERSQQYALDASAMAVELAALRGQLKSGGDDTVKAEIKRRTLDLAEKERHLQRAKDDLRLAANRPGIMIARWKATGEAGLSAKAADAGSLAVSGEDTRAGFVILGGLRVVTLVPGEDFWWLINNLRDADKEYLERIGLTTHLIQARDLAYVSDLSTTRTAAFLLDVRKLGGTGIEQAKIAGYWSFSGQYSNSGNMGRVTWRREPFCAVCGMDLPGLSPARDPPLQQKFGVHAAHLDPATYQGWRTISATVTNLRDAPFGIDWVKQAAKYKAKRTMWSAPACPFCGGRTCPVVIEGHDGTACDAASGHGNDSPSH